MNKIEHRLVRSKRKTLAVHVLPDGTVEVRAPLRLPVTVVEAFVSSREGWIKQHRKEALLRQREREGYTAGNGQTVLWLGEEYPVALHPGETVRLENRSVFLPKNEAIRKQALTKWYREQAKERLPRRTEEISRGIGIYSEKVSVGSAKSRWGSCTGTNEIRLSWRLILLPEELIDYVIIHELCHTVEHNHSARFWKRVGRCLPGYAEKRKSLRAFEIKHAKQLSWL